MFFTRPFRIAAWTVIGFTAAWSLLVILTGFVFCTPVAFNWDHSIKGGKCANQTTGFIVIGVLDLIIDCAVFTLPIPMIWNLKVSLGNKVALFSIFGLGISTMVISCLRIEALVSVSFTDITFTASYPTLYSFLEPGIGITVACGPLFRPLLKNTRLGRHFIRDGTQNSKKGTSGSAAFERLEEPAHPLIDYPPSNIRTIISSRNLDNSKSVYISDEIELAHIPKDIGSASSPSNTIEGGIMVKKEWKMQRE